MLEWIISSSVLAATLIAVRYVFKGRIRPLIQYAFWVLLLIRLLAPFSLGGSFLSVNNLLHPSEKTEISAILPEPAIYQNDLQFTESIKQEDTNGVIGDPIVVNSSGTAQASTNFSEMNQKAEDSPQSTRLQPSVYEENSSTPYAAELILLIIWAAGFLCVLAWFLFCNIKYTISLRKSRIPLKKLNSGSWQLPVYFSWNMDTPCLFGLLHPAIYVTDEVTRNEVALRHVMIHETVHFRHGDHIWSVLRGICIALHWFNPFVWWAGFLSRRDCELACDEATLKILGENERSEYGKTLLSITCAHSPAGMLTAATIAGKKSAIYERIKIMTSRNNKSAISIIAALLIVVVAAGCTFTGATENAIEESAKAPAVVEEQNDDIRTQFLSWRFTSNLNDRWKLYQDEINTIMENMTVPEQEEAPVGIVEPDPDIQAQIEAAAAKYYNGISEFTSEELIQKMINNRTPMSDDSLYLEYGVQTEFADVTFGEGKEDPFASGLIYDFDARVIVNGHELLPDDRYTPEEDGYVHITGQITVDEGLITNIYVAKQPQGNSVAVNDSENWEITSAPEDIPDVRVNAQTDHFRGLFEGTGIEVAYDADVMASENPEAIVTAVPHTFTGDEVKHLAEILFDGNEIYEVNMFKTTDELRMFIEADQNVLDSLDPEVEPELYEYRRELFRNEIAAFEAMLSEAKESYEPQKPDWAFKSDVYEKAYMEAMGQDPRELNEEIRVYSQVDGKTAFVDCVSTTKESFILNWFRFWVEDGYQEEQLQETPEEAEAIVKDQLQKMGLADRWTIRVCKTMYQNDEREEEKDHSLIRNGGYYYDIELVPQYAGCEVLPQDGMFASAELTSWPYRYEYEKLHIQFSNGRIVYMDYRNPLEIVGMAEMDSKAMTLEEAITCFEEHVQSKQFRDQYYSQTYGQDPSNVNVTISAIEFGILRIRTSEEEAVYEMIPVWNFKGSTTCIYETETVASPLYGNEEEIMAINAVDGSVVLREKGRR